ncbi:unnamed protein product [Fusarium graminearum]|uniref:Uncharacterized protein n=1 Tax=Gibberella zeae TaxID=5518 RepID=A0A4E9DBZ8_GIBZA|nr:unnamed protein product [Fusarium graminearum]
MTLSYGTSAESNVLSVMGVDRVKGLSLEEIESTDQEQKESQAHSVVNQNRGQQIRQTPTLILAQAAEDPYSWTFSYKSFLFQHQLRCRLLPHRPTRAGYPVNLGRYLHIEAKKLVSFADRGAPMIAIATKTTHLFSFVLACCASEVKELSLVTDPEPRGIHKGTSWDVFLILQVPRISNFY